MDMREGNMKYLFSSSRYCLFLLRKASTERLHKAAAARKTTTYSYFYITNSFTVACPPLSSIKYNAEHLKVLGPS